MKVVQIKKGGKVRTIYMPSFRELVYLNDVKNQLDWIYLNMGVPECVHGFWFGRNPASNATAHIGYRYTYCLDMKDFFDSIQEGLLRNVPKSLRKLSLIKGAPRQGLPTSPILSNIAMHPIDLKIMKMAHPSNVVYTRYADDITISSNDLGSLERLKNCIGYTLAQNGLRLNLKKTKLQDGKGKRRVITGLSVGESDVRATYKHRRKLRAAAHKNKMSAVRGWQGWCQCYIPYSSNISVEPVTDINGQRLFKASKGDIICCSNTYRGAIRRFTKKCEEIVRERLCG